MEPFYTEEERSKRAFKEVATAGVIFLVYVILGLWILFSSGCSENPSEPIQNTESKIYLTLYDSTEREYNFENLEMSIERDWLKIDGMTITHFYDGILRFEIEAGEEMKLKAEGEGISQETGIESGAYQRENNSFKWNANNHYYKNDSVKEKNILLTINKYR